MSISLNFVKKTILLTLCFALLSCNLKPVVKSNGIQNLGNRTSLLIPGETNKNDVIKIFGETLIKEMSDEDKWTYFETIGRKTLGKNKIIKNTMLILEFNNKGILKTKKTLNKDDFNKVEFDKNETISSGLSDSLSKRIFSSVRKRAQNKLGTVNK